MTLMSLLHLVVSWEIFTLIICIIMSVNTKSRVYNDGCRASHGTAWSLRYGERSHVGSYWKIPGESVGRSHCPHLADLQLEI